MQEQGHKLMAMPNTATNGTARLDTLMVPLKRSGGANAGYGVKAEDHDKVADPFLWTLGKGLATPSPQRPRMPGW